jgi:hypothetical protein
MSKAGVHTLVALSLLAAPAATAQPAWLYDLMKLPEPRTYKKAEGSKYGYKEKLQKDGSWKVTASTLERDGTTFSQEMVLHRSAEIARNAGKQWFQVTDLTTMSPGPGSNQVEVKTWLIILPVDDPQLPIACRSKNPASCSTFNVDHTLATIGPTLVLPKVD